METFASLLILWAQDSWKGFLASARSVGRLSTQCESPARDVAGKAFTKSQESLTSLLCFYRVDKGNSHHRD